MQNSGRGARLGSAQFGAGSGCLDSDRGNIGFAAQLVIDVSAAAERVEPAILEAMRVKFVENRLVFERDRWFASACRVARKALEYGANGASVTDIEQSIEQDIDMIIAERMSNLDG
jgi:hypothetical protein